MENNVEYVGTVKASSLLKICPQRVRRPGEGDAAYQAMDAPLQLGAQAKA